MCCYTLSTLFQTFLLFAVTERYLSPSSNPRLNRCIRSRAIHLASHDLPMIFFLSDVSCFLLLISDEEENVCVMAILVA